MNHGSHLQINNPFFVKLAFSTLIPITKENKSHLFNRWLNADPLEGYTILCPFVLVAHHWEIHSPYIQKITLLFQSHKVEV